MLLSLFGVTALPVQVHEGPKRKVGRTGKLKISLVKPHGTSNTVSITELVFCKDRKQNRSNHDTTDGIPPLGRLMSDSALKFPFLCDPSTKRVIQRSKVLFLMRGLSGSGKSTVVRAITETYLASVVCSADDYFLQDGVYRFDASLLSSAHSACQSKAKTACNHGVPVIVIDNTHVRRWEMKFYLELASHRNYVVVPVLPKTPWRWNPVELAAKNKHGVDVETLQRKVGQFDDVIPVYYAWFLNETSSQQLSFISHCLLKDCILRLPDFANKLLWHLRVSPSDVFDWDTLWGILQGYYTSGNKSGCLVHCTAKFCGAGRAVGAKSYHAQQSVQDSIGQTTTLTITSICFSPRSVGARVQLNEEQLLLFDKPEEKDWNGVQPSSAAAVGARSPHNQHSNSRNQNDTSADNGRNSQGRSKKSSSGRKNSQRSTPEKDALSDIHTHSNYHTGNDFSPLRPKTRPLSSLQGRSAHITLGTAHGYESRETNFDVLRLCDMEADRAASEGEYVAVTGGTARYFGDGVCCVYFNKPMYVHTIYSGFY